MGVSINELSNFVSSAEGNIVVNYIAKIASEIDDISQLISAYQNFVNINSKALQKIKIKDLTEKVNKGVIKAGYNSDHRDQIWEGLILTNYINLQQLVTNKADLLDCDKTIKKIESKFKKDFEQTNENLEKMKNSVEQLKANKKAMEKSGIEEEIVNQWLNNISNMQKNIKDMTSDSVAEGSKENKGKPNSVEKVDKPRDQGKVAEAKKDKKKQKKNKVDDLSASESADSELRRMSGAKLKESKEKSEGSKEKEGQKQKDKSADSEL